MRRLSISLLTLCAVLQAQAAFAQYGLNFSGVGPVNRGIGGVATATPLDAAGAIHWNPATISALPTNEMIFGVDAILPVVDLDSSIAANSLGPGVPPVDLAGSSDSDNGWFAAPAFAVVQHLEGTPYTAGLGIMTVAGFGENFAASGSNPVLFPTDPALGTGIPGFGNLFAEAAFVEIAPTLSMQVTDNISVGAGPTVTIGRLQSSPFPFTARNDANGNGTETFPDGTHSRYHWGGGFQAGLYVTTESCWNFGLSFKSEQWFEPFTYSGVDEAGASRDFKTKLELPYIAGLGVSYTGLANTVIGFDLRHFGWSKADLFGDPATFNADDSLRGLGWDSQWTFAVGAQHALSDCIAVRAGYAYGASPIDGHPESGLNVGSPLILEHSLSAGATVRLSHALSMHLAYTHGIENELNGPIQSVLDGGTNFAVPGSTLNQRVSAHILTAGFTAAF